MTPTATATPPPGPLTITYAYDALRRLTSATYSNGVTFHYTYDAAGNVLEYRSTISGQSSVTSYQYDAANQLLTAAKDSTTWHYTYDGNGSLVLSTPGSEVANGAKRYTYNTAGFLLKVETYTNEWQTQAEMTYDGLGNRLRMTAAGVTTQYELDNGRVLSANAAGNVTYYLYGLGPIGELTTDWAYSLPDGKNTPRQLTDVNGSVTLTVLYNPWGNTFETLGSGNFTYGYLGGIMDAATGLIYIGKGQYYDPSTGRFLTRQVHPNSTNPYVPWNFDPAGSLIGPLALLSLIARRKRGKPSKIEPYLFLLVLLVILPLSIGAACTLPGQGDETPPTTPEAPPDIEPPEPGQGGGNDNQNPPPPTETPELPSECRDHFDNGCYDAIKAIYFAQTNMSKSDFRKHYRLYEGGDNTNCTNFVSYALRDGGLKEDSTTWKQDSEAWIRANELYDFLVSKVGFIPTPEFENSGNYIYTIHPYPGQTLNQQRDLFLRLRENHQSFESRQLIKQRWGDYLLMIRNTQPGDLVFYEDWKKSGWSHVGIITEDWQSPTHIFFNTSMNPDFDEPRMIDHDGIGDLTQARSIGDTWSMRIHKVVVLRAPCRK